MSRETDLAKREGERTTETERAIFMMRGGSPLMHA